MITVRILSELFLVDVFSSDYILLVIKIGIPYFALILGEVYQIDSSLMLRTLVDD